jgi:hypothetical protein
VLELVEGQALDERLLSGPLPGAEVLALALQIADVGGRREQISVGGGRFPRWSRTGNEVLRRSRRLDDRGALCRNAGPPDRARAKTVHARKAAAGPSWLALRHLCARRTFHPSRSRSAALLGFHTGLVVLNFFEHLRTLLQPQ